MKISLENKSISPAQLSNVLESVDNRQFDKNIKYFEGDNVTITQTTAARTGKPNNKIPLPFARRTVNDVVGYSGKPGAVQYILDGDQPDKSVEMYRDIADTSNLWLNTTEVYQDALINGEAAELAWTDEDGMLRFYQVPRNQVVFLYDSTIEENLICGVRYYIVRTFDASGNLEYISKAEAYFDDKVQYFTGVIEEKDFQRYNPQRDKKEAFPTQWWIDTTWTLDSEEEHLLGYVPLYPYRVNSDRKGIFQPAIPIIDRLDAFGSDSIANALDRFNETILALSKKIDNETADKIKELRIIDNLGTDGDFVKYIQREIDMSSTIDGFKLFERLYYELVSVPNMNDDKFNAKSGIAIAYALVPFENMVATIETYFNKGLEYRFKIINRYLELKSAQPLEYQIKWNRNLPYDLQQRADIVLKIKQAGILSDETLIKMFPEDIIENVEEELARLNEQKDREIAAFQSMAADEPQIDINEEDDGDE
jgi:SPP1 family phage portal protein